MEITFIAIGFVIGIVIGMLFVKIKMSTLATRLELKEEEANRLKQENISFRTDVEALTKEKNELLHERNMFDVELKSLRESHKNALSQIKEERERDREEEKDHDQKIHDAYAARIDELKTHYENTINDLKNDFAHQKAEIKEQFQKVIDEGNEAHRKTMDEQEKRHREAVGNMQMRFNETMEKLTAQMKAATSDMLKERQREFEESSHTNLGRIVNPLRETIANMKKAMEDNATQQANLSGEMKTNIEHMLNQSRAAKESTDELTRVFKHTGKVQGDWGETILDELLKSQGLTKGIQYDTQATIRDASGNNVKSDEGNIMRPDVIVHLDQRRELIIDSKVSLSAYMDYVNAEDEKERQKFLKAHIESIQKHVNELSKKDYSSYIQPPKVKMYYVIMFVPHTGALWTALNAQPDLWRKAMEKNVFIADEQTLYAALKIINLTWTQIIQKENHEKVYSLADEMLKRVGQFWKEYEAMGKALASLTAAYESGRKKITEGGYSINTTANLLIKLGAKQNSKNPIPKLLDDESDPSTMEN